MSNYIKQILKYFNTHLYIFIKLNPESLLISALVNLLLATKMSTLHVHQQLKKVSIKIKQSTTIQLLKMSCI